MTTSTSLRWVRDQGVWDGQKVRIFGDCQGAFNGLPDQLGVQLPQQWWRLEDAAQQVHGYGWIDQANGDAELSVAVASERRGVRTGSHILQHLEDEARQLGFSEVSGVVSGDNPDRERVANWLALRGYRPHGPPVVAGKLDLALQMLGKGIPITFLKQLSAPRSPAPPPSPGSAGPPSPRGDVAWY